MRRRIISLVAGACTVLVGVPLAAPAATATVATTGGATAALPSEEDRPLSVDELDLSGVDGGATAALPESAPEPAEHVDAEPAAPEAPSARARSVAPDAETPVEAPVEAPVDPDVLTAPLDTDAFSVLGVTWDAGPDDVVIRYRVRQADVWTDWEAVGTSDIAPDDGAQDDVVSDAGRGGTDPIVAAGSDGVQIWAQSDTGEVSGLKAVLIDPGTRAADAQAAQTTAAITVPGQPAIITRAGWGADESLRTCSPDYSPQMLTAAVHHTASANGYSADAVPGLIRGFYAYHTRSEAQGGRGWCDVGYNFFVDRFGRIFEGRAGGVSATVVGVHTGGFNSRTIGIAAIGDYGTAVVPDALTSALASLIAWKFSIHGITAGTTVTMVSGGGATKWPAGQAVTFHTIYGHRDANYTSCPGQNLYDLLPYLRTRVAELANAAVSVSPRGSWDSMSTTPSSVRVRGWAVDPETAAPVVIEVRVDGVLTTVLADQSRPDVAALYPALGPLHGFDHEVPAAPGSHVVCLAAVNIGEGTNVSLGCRTATIVNAAPIGNIDSVETSPGRVAVTGWALDPDTTASIQVHLYIDGAGTAILADLDRPDVAAVYNKGAAHGFRLETELAAGSHQVCAWAIDAAGGSNTVIGCRTFTVRGVPVPGQDVLDVAHTLPGGLNLWEVPLEGAGAGTPALVSSLVGGGFSYAASRTASGNFGDVTAQDDGTPDWLVAHQQPGGGLLLWVVGGGADATPRVWADLRGGGWSWAESRQYVADVDGDGLDDVVSVHRTGLGNGRIGANVWVHRNTGTSFAAPVLWLQLDSSVGGTSPASQPFTDVRYLFGDTDGDGRADLVTVHRGGGATTAITYATWRSTGSAFATQPRLGTTGYAGGWSYDLSRDVLADVDGDGRADLVEVHRQPDGGVLVWNRSQPSSGSAGFGDPTLVEDLRTGGWSWDYSRQSAADVDGDGRDELVTVHSQPGGGLLVWAHEVAGTPRVLADMRGGGWSWAYSRETVATVS